MEGSLEIITAGGWVELTPLSFDGFQLGLQVGGRYYFLEGRVESRRDAALAAEDTLEGPVPLVGASVALFPGPLEIFASARGFYLSYEDDDTDVLVKYLEAEVGVAFNFGDHLAVGGGYKVFYFLIEEEGELLAEGERTMEVAHHGPVAWVRLRF